MKHSLPTTASILALFFVGTLVGCTPQQPVPTTPPVAQASSSEALMEHSSEAAMMQSKGNPQTAQEKIDNAMSAAPETVAADASIADWPGADGKLIELRKGGNGWTCFPDDPRSPGNDPICADANAMVWFQAYMQKKTPKLSQDGMAYMLQGGSDASNTDPFAEKPVPGEDWMAAPPHIMVFPAGKLDAKTYGVAMNGGPWVMWADTPYQHVMMPVQ